MVGVVERHREVIDDVGKCGVRLAEAALGFHGFRPVRRAAFGQRREVGGLGRGLHGGGQRGGVGAGAFGIDDLEHLALRESGEPDRDAGAGGFQLRPGGRADEADDRAQVRVLRVIGRDGHVAFEHRGGAFRSIGQHQRGGRAGGDDIEGAREQRHVARFLQLRHLEQRGRADGVGENHMVAVQVEAAVFRPLSGQRAEGHLGRAGSGGQLARIVEVGALAPRRAGVGLEIQVRVFRRGGVAAVSAVESHAAALHPAAGPAARHADQLRVEKLRRLAARPELHAHALVRRAARLVAVEGGLAGGVDVGRGEEAPVVHVRPFVGRDGGKRGEAEDGGGEEVLGVGGHGGDEVEGNGRPRGCGLWRAGLCSGFNRAVEGKLGGIPPGVRAHFFRIAPLR